MPPKNKHFGIYNCPPHLPERVQTIQLVQYDNIYVFERLCIFFC